ncbi:MAG: hypothetical protein KDK39_05480 [Leptospiraceae bacterium]|nr:hypothetical protein [Leptospiraceae bacterium]
MKNLVHIALGSWYTMLLVSLVGIAIQNSPPNGFLQSDSLWPISLLRDWQTGRLPLAGWRLPPAPGFFPDLAVLLFGMPFDFQPLVSFGLFALWIGVALFGTLHRGYQQISMVGPGQSRQTPDYFLAGTSILSLYLILDQQDFQHSLGSALLPASHGGAATVALLSASVVLGGRLPQRQKQLSNLALFGLALAAALTLISDRLFLFYGLLPLLCAAFWFPVVRRPIVIYLVFVLASLACMLPLLVSPGGMLLSEFDLSAIGSAWALKGMRLESWLAWLQNALRSARLELYLYLGFGASILATWHRQARSRPWRTWMLFLGSAIFINISVTMLITLPTGILIHRYLVMASLSALVGISLNLSLQLPRLCTPWPMGALMLTGLCAGLTLQGPPRIARPGNTQPRQSECMRDFVSRNQLHSGVATYWQARVWQVSLQKPVLALTRSMQVNWWNSNVLEYFGWYGRPHYFDWLITAGFDDALLTRLGEPRQKQQCGPLELWDYSGPAGNALRHKLNFDASRRELLRLTIGR